MLTNLIKRNQTTVASYAARQFGVASHTRVAIVGGGAAGTNVSAQLVNSGVFRPEEITVFDASRTHHYQPGYTNIAGGVWNNR